MTIDAIWIQEHTNKPNGSIYVKFQPLPKPTRVQIIDILSHY